MKTIILTGPESTGKTTLAKALSKRLNAPWAVEYARTYLDENGLDYEYKDLYQIALGQYQQELAFAKKKPTHLILDTSFLVLKIWSEYRFGKVHPFIEEQFQTRKGLFVLCGTDVLWEADPQRQNPKERTVLYDLYRTCLEGYKKDFIDIRGTVEQRVEFVVQKIN